MVELNFGFWPTTWSLRFAGMTIDPLPKCDSTISEVFAHRYRLNDWIYPPLVRKSSFAEPRKRHTPIPAEVYQLPSTHRLHIPPRKTRDGVVLGEFLIAFLGLIDGIRLVPDGWSHFYRTKVKRHRLNDLVCNKPEIERLMADAVTFWNATPNKSIRSLIFGAIHWFLFSHSYTHQFEVFSAQYTVFDTLFRIHCTITPPNRTISHSHRPSYLCRAYRLPIPQWARMRSRRCALSTLRNDLVHEAQFAGRAIGFSAPAYRYPIATQLANLNSRIILSILGIRCRYVRTPVQSRMMQSPGLLP